MQQELSYIKAQVKKHAHLMDAVRTITFDQSTICPPEAMEEKNEILAFLEQQAFVLMHDKRLTEYICGLYADRDALGEWDRTLIEQLYRGYLTDKNISDEDAYAFSLAEGKAFTSWIAAKEASDFSVFKESLSAVITNCRKRAELRELTPEESGRIIDTYDRLLDIFERGMTQSQLDPLFTEARERLMALIDRIGGSKKTIRTDFLSRRVSVDEQRRVTEYLMALQGFDRNRGIFSTSEHAYTERLSANDIRITTHFYTDNFISNIYTVLHETGHALFDQRQPRENNAYYIYEGKTLGMHESVSRFYENILGRSEAFISLIYPKLKELMPDALYDVSERELYEAVNTVSPSYIRTEADEVTYGLHIIIRYELERDIYAGRLSVDELPDAWNKKYEKYLNITPRNDSEGVLQDVHWTSDFGYFPTYLLGNFYNAMYYNRMRQELDIPAALRAGSLKSINNWMTENVFARADRLAPAEWIYDITGRTLTAEDFLTYLEDKYTALYEL